MATAIIDSKCLRIPAFQKEAEEIPSLWTRITNCVSSILKQLWEWITCCCRTEERSLVLTEKRIDEMVEAVLEKVREDGKIPFPLLMMGWGLRIPEKERESNLSVEIPDQKTLDAEIGEIKKELTTNVLKWDFRIFILKANQDETGTTFISLKQNQDSCSMLPVLKILTAKNDENEIEACLRSNFFRGD
jgi:hypothetical protein